MSIKFSGKKIGALLLVIIVWVFAYFLYDNYYDNSTHTVYITYTGEKYHRSTCQYLHSSKISITLENAVKQGYDGCSRCNPPRLKTKRAHKAIIRRPLYEGGIFMPVFPVQNPVVSVCTSLLKIETDLFQGIYIQ